MTRVLGLVGVSFCGSTILEMLLQTHPRIVGVGELWRACGERYQGGLCWQCGSDCALLDPSVLPLSYSNLHHQLYARADVDWLVDGSKWPGHFIRAQREQSDVELRVVLLIKRPEWAVASFLRRERDVDYAVRAFVDWYSSAARWLRESDVPYIVLPYEEMALNFPAALRRVLALLDGDLDYDFDLDSYADVERYPLHRFHGNESVLHGYRGVPRLIVERDEPPELSAEQVRQLYDTYADVLSLRAGAGGMLSTATKGE